MVRQPHKNIESAMLQRKLTLLSACWSPVDRRPRINSLSCLLLSRFPFTFSWFADSEHLSLDISFSLTANQFDCETVFRCEFQWVMVIVIGTTFCSDKIDNIFDVLSS